MAAHSVTKAIALAKAEAAQPTPPSPPGTWRGYCLWFVRLMLGVPKRADSAREAWEDAEGRHSGDRRPPKGAPAFYGIGRWGHIALSNGDGRVWSTDIRRAGHVDLVPLEDIEAAWGARYLGWSETLNGVRVIAKPRHAAPKVEDLRPGVRLGKRDPQVKVLQRALIAAGYGPIPHAVTEHYGRETAAAVARFHDANPRFRSRPRDPQIGPEGFAALQRQAAAKA